MTQNNMPPAGTTPAQRPILERIKKLSNAQLKYIAFISMFIDHFNKSMSYPNLDGGKLLYLSNFFDILGRIAFPLFAFMLVEGFYRTHSRWHYLGNLLLFGVISEVPFDLFTTKELMNWRWNNVMFTLAFMLVTIWIVDVIREKIGDEKKWLWFLISIPVVAIMCFLAMFCSLDYDYNGILMAYFFYLFRNHPFPRILFGYLSVVKEPWALLGLGLTLTYNGERGKQSKLLNYLFYPVHLLILGLLRFYFNI